MQIKHEIKIQINHINLTQQNAFLKLSRCAQHAHSVTQECKLTRLLLSARGLMIGSLWDLTSVTCSETHFWLAPMTSLAFIQQAYNCFFVFGTALTHEHELVEIRSSKQMYPACLSDSSQLGFSSKVMALLKLLRKLTELFLKFHNTDLYGPWNTRAVCPFGVCLSSENPQLQERTKC